MLILFDGVCNLCNGTVQFLIRRDPRKKFYFASLQSPKGQAEMKRFGLDPEALHSIVVIDGDRAYQRSAAAIHVAASLGGLWSIFKIFSFVPKFLRDPVYNLIARNRYRLFGKRDECMIPTPEMKSHFLE
jgi:predicted DCC family thiol-disulfide oxidoreductase YuxK